MALGTILGMAATAAAGSAASAGVSKLFGKKNRGFSGGFSPAPAGSIRPNYSPPGFSGGGLSGKFENGQYSVQADHKREALNRQLAATFPQHANELAGLRARVAPGFSEFRDQRLRQIEDARTKAVGNLSENLQRRRVLGSSFGGDALARAEAEFGNAKAEAAATSTLQEIEATHNLINEEAGVRRQEFQTFLTELNLQGQLASSMATSVNGALAANSQLEAQLAAQEQAGAGRYFGQNGQSQQSSILGSVAQSVSGPLSRGIGGIVQSTFNGSGNFFGGGGSDVGMGSWAPTVTYG